MYMATASSAAKRAKLQLKQPLQVFFRAQTVKYDILGFAD